MKNRRVVTEEYIVNQSWKLMCAEILKYIILTYSYYKIRVMVFAPVIMTETGSILRVQCMYVCIIYVCTSVVIRSLAKCVPCVRRALRHDVCPSCSQENEKHDDDGLLLIYSRKSTYLSLLEKNCCMSYSCP